MNFGKNWRLLLGKAPKTLLLINFLAETVELSGKQKSKTNFLTRFTVQKNASNHTEVKTLETAIAQPVRGIGRHR